MNVASIEQGRLNIEEKGCRNRWTEMVRPVSAIFACARRLGVDGLLEARDSLLVDRAVVADHDAQTTAVSVERVAPTTRDVGSMATYFPSGARLLSAQWQTPVVRVAQRASQANVAVPVADAAVGRLSSCTHG